jgi:hypothetical protein
MSCLFQAVLDKCDSQEKSANAQFAQKVADFGSKLVEPAIQNGAGCNKLLTGFVGVQRHLAVAGTTSRSHRQRQAVRPCPGQTVRLPRRLLSPRGAGVSGGFKQSRSSQHVNASAAQQSSVSGKTSGLLRFARNDDRICVGSLNYPAKAAFRSSTRSVRSHGKRSPSALRPKWP